MDEISYEDYCKAHGVKPLNSIKEACRIANVGQTRFYELVSEGEFVLIPNGGRRNVTGLNLYRHHQKLLAAAQSSRAA